MCGYAPARPLRQRRIVGAVIAGVRGRSRLTSAGRRGSAYFTETQAQCLLKGWWGLLAVYATVPVLVRNWVHAASHRRHLAEPSSRDPSVVTPLPEPVLARPLRKRPLVYVTSSTALALLVLISTFSGVALYRLAVSGGPPEPDHCWCWDLPHGGGPRGGVLGRRCLVKAELGPVANTDSCDGAAFQETTEEQWYCSTGVVGRARAKRLQPRCSDVAARLLPVPKCKRFAGRAPERPPGRMPGTAGGPQARRARAPKALLSQ